LRSHHSMTPWFQANVVLKRNTPFPPTLSL